MVVGSSTRRCGPDKQWSGEQPECSGKQIKIKQIFGIHYQCIP